MIFVVNAKDFVNSKYNYLAFKHRFQKCLCIIDVKAACEGGLHAVLERHSILITDQLPKNLIFTSGPLKNLIHQIKGLRSEEHTSELQSRQYLVCRLLLEKQNSDNRRAT